MKNAITIYDEQIEDVDLDGFPLVSDFSVELRESAEGGQHVHFVSAGNGTLASFPGWDHADRDLRHFTSSDVPFGSIDEPYDDRDDGWRILIFEHRGFVCVLEADSPTATEFPRYFRVPVTRYFEAWALVIDFYNPITPFNQS